MQYSFRVTCGESLGTGIAINLYSADGLHIAACPYLYVAALGRHRTPRRRNRQLSDLNVRHVLHKEHRLVQLAFGATSSHCAVGGRLSFLESLT